MVTSGLRIGTPALATRGFADRYSVPRSYGSYEELVACPDIDIVYVATEHITHLPCARLALEAGRHTLIEKPIGLNAAQAIEIARLASERNLFCTEALWTFFLPRFDIVRQILESGVLGEIPPYWLTLVSISAPPYDPASRSRRRPLLDLGIYPVSLATWVAGSPRPTSWPLASRTLRRQRPARRRPS